MRWILICLVALNVVYFGWEAYQSYTVDAPKAKDQSSLAPLKGKKLELLTEVRSNPGGLKPPPSLAGIEADSSNALRREVDRVQVSKQAMCISIGPIAEQQDGEKIVDGLYKAGYQSKLQSLELSKDVQYWVILPSYSTRREALAVLRQLQSKKIDSYLVESGDFKNAISLGLFSKKSSAQGILDKIQEVGFAAEIREKVRVKNEFWVRILPGQTIENLQKTLQPLVSADSGVKISKAACEMFALSK